ncbi:ethanolamine kinase 1-like protein [Leptotrombidium deliense]|uniref:ethanolamine kinase n=1 Tax=Leptotrombidium deliense TaxID=299467 RepID=A0A443RWC5_9ACAR|nr:ethanolamine kinase 1-like protein [Leptotrombidium deliense]
MDTNNNSNSLNVKRIDLTVNPSEICEKGVQIVRMVRPEWSEKEISVKIFTDGLTNRLIGCYLPQNPSDKVLVRVFGEKTEIYIDREIELQIMVDLHNNSFGPPVYCAFNNGIVYGFEDGIILDKHLVRKPEIAYKIAAKMAKMHTLQILNNSKREALVFQLMRKFLQQLFEATLIDR